MSPEAAPDEDQTAPAVDRAVLLDAFDHDDPALRPEEKETTLRFARDEDRVAFYTEEHGVGRRLIAHPEAVLEGVILRDDRARPSVAPDKVTSDDEVVGVRGTLPVGALSVRRSSRKSTGHADIVSERVLDEVAQ